MKKNPLIKALGFPENARILLPNHDDLGMNYGSNKAFIELKKVGFVNSGSVMVPCPWFPNFCELYKANPGLNVGVHLTLTSEWKDYRWKPISTCNRSSGLIDPDGYFWKNRALLTQTLNKNAVETEFRAQIESALKAGIDVTHLDCHMGVGFIQDFIDIYIKLGKEYRVPILLPRKIAKTIELYKINTVDLSFYTDIIDSLEIEGQLLVDNFAITPCFESIKASLGYERMILDIPEGITFLSLHPNVHGEISAIDPVMYQSRIDEFNLFSSQFNVQWAKDHNIHLISFKNVRDILRRTIVAKA